MYISVLHFLFAPGDGARRAVVSFEVVLGEDGDGCAPFIEMCSKDPKKLKLPSANNGTKRKAAVIVQGMTFQNNNYAFKTFCF